MTHTYTRRMDAIASLFAARRSRFSAMSEDQRTSLVIWVNARIVPSSAPDLFSPEPHDEVTRIHFTIASSLKLARVALKLSAAFFSRTFSNKYIPLGETPSWLRYKTSAQRSRGNDTHSWIKYASPVPNSN